MKASKIDIKQERVKNLARRICDARIDAAVIEYAKTIIDMNTVSVTDLEHRLAELKKGSAKWPEYEKRKTIETVSSGRGNFKW